MSTALAWTDGDWTLAKKSGPPLFSAPFNGDSGAYLLQQDWAQAIASWTAGALNTAHPDYATYYLVEESPLQPLDGGLAKWTRTYAKVPSARSDYEAYAARLPGLSYGATAGGANPILAITNAVKASTTVTITTSTAHGLIPGNTVAITYYTSLFGLKSQEYTFGAYVAAIPTATTFTYTTNVSITGWNFEWAQLSGHARAPLSRVVDSRLDFAYYLPGVTGGITTPDDIPILPVPTIYDQFGALTETYSTLSTPTQSAYQTQINAGTWIVAEPTSKRRWRGNIYEAVTRYIRAQ